MLNPDSICPVADKAKQQIYESEQIKQIDIKNEASIHRASMIVGQFQSLESKSKLTDLLYRISTNI